MLIRHTVLFITRGCVFAGDLLTLVLTWIKTFRQWREARTLNMRLSISTCLLRDGKSILKLRAKARLIMNQQGLPTSCKLSELIPRCDTQVPPFSVLLVINIMQMLKYNTVRISEGRSLAASYCHPHRPWASSTKRCRLWYIKPYYTSQDFTNVFYDSLPSLSTGLC